MRLIDCYIENFGSLSEKRISFNSGLNCFCSANGSGKTTLATFIATMLFGFPETKKQSLDENDRKKYLPWQGGRYGGSLTIEVDDKVYTIERTFGARASDDSFILRDAARGSVSTDYSERIGEELFGIDRDGFLRTVYLSEKNLSVKNENKSISAKLGDLVGVDGDLGGFDDAIDALEEKRKFYSKRGNGGEIGALRARISALRPEEERLAAAVGGAEEREGLMRSLNIVYKALKEKKEVLTSKMLGSAKAREKIANEERYRAMMSHLSAERTRLDKITEFFGGRVPSSSEIDEMRFALLEGERILREETTEEGGELTKLASLYSTLDARALADAERAVGEEERETHFISTLEEGEDRYSREIRRLFPNVIPTSEEIASLKARRGAGSAILCAVGTVTALASVVGGMLADPIVFAGAAVGGVMILVGACRGLMQRSKAKRLCREFEIKIGRAFVHTHAGIQELERDAKTARSLVSDRERELLVHGELLADIRARLDDFLRCYGADGTDDYAAGVAMVRRGYTDYYSLSLIRKTATEDRAARLTTADAMIKRARNFLSAYETETNDPFGELSALASEHAHRLKTVRESERECEEYARIHGITGEPTERGDDSAALAEELSLIEDEMREHEQKQTILSEEIAADGRAAERLIDVREELSELESKLEKYEKRYSIIQMTINMLREASDNMTSRYVGKTRERFDHYEKAIGGEGGDFTLDTDFSLTRAERGAARTLESYSRGTRDLYALALRLALIDSLYRNESPVIMLDDPFISMDDGRISHGMTLLTELARERQILYFTCAEGRRI